MFHQPALFSFPIFVWGLIFLLIATFLGTAASSAMAAKSDSSRLFDPESKSLLKTSSASSSAQYLTPSLLNIGPVFAQNMAAQDPTSDTRSSDAWSHDIGPTTDAANPFIDWEESILQDQPSEAQPDAISEWEEVAPIGRVRMSLTDTEPTVEIEADLVLHDRTSGQLQFIGNVLITRADEVITGTRALWHEPSRSAEISGEVTIKTADFTATATRAAVNMDLKLAKIYDGQAFFPARHYYVQGDVIERQGPETLYINEAVFTTCDGTKPSWSLKASNFLVNRNGVATASSVRFNNKYFPMLFLPYFMVPLQQDRQTGFLIPSIGNSSRDGFFAATPFFLELGEDRDLTFLPFYRSERGLAMTVEARYNLSAGQGIWLATYLRDNKNNVYRFKNPGGPVRNSRDLYWLRAINTWKAGDWDLNLDLDLVSDPLFLYAFRHDADGFHYSQNTLTNYFGRSLNEELDPTRLSTFFAQRVLADTYLQGSLSYTDNLYRHKNIDTLQNLTSLRFDLVSRPFGFGPDMPSSPGGPRLTLSTQYDFFTRKYNNLSAVTETGHRLHAAPSVFYNHNLGGIFNFKADAGLDFSAYIPSGLRPGAWGQERHSGFDKRISANLDLELSTSLQRIFDGGPGDAVGTLHQVTPIVSLEIVEAPDQSKLPYWDMLDRKLNRRTLRYGLLNTFTSKTPKLNADGEISYYDYRQLIKIGVYSSYEFASNLDLAERNWARYYTNGYFDRGVGPVEFELMTNLSPNLSARLLSSLDGRTGQFTSHEVSMNLGNRRGDRISFIYDYDQPTLRQGPAQVNNINQIRGDAVLNLSSGWSAQFSTRYDFLQNQELETNITLSYSSQCYGVSLVYYDSYDDRKIGLVINLLGLGSFGTPTTSLSSASDSH
jgi:LPS-assembly protein